MQEKVREHIHTLKITLAVFTTDPLLKELEVHFSNIFENVKYVFDKECQMNGQMNGKMDGWMNGWMGGWMGDGWVGGWMDG